MIAALAGFAARSVLMQSPVGAIVRAVPRKLWIALAIAAVLLAAFLWHQHRAHAAIAAAEMRGEQRAYARIETEARALERKANDLGRKISNRIRSKTDEDNRRIAGTADTLRVRGPGQATCPGGARVPAGAGRPQSPGGQPDAAGPQMPADELAAVQAAVPWPWLVDRAEQCDLNLTEVTAWRSWYVQQSAAWDKLRGERK